MRPILMKGIYTRSFNEKNIKIPERLCQTENEIYRAYVTRAIITNILSSQLIKSVQQFRSWQIETHIECQNYKNRVRLSS